MERLTLPVDEEGLTQSFTLEEDLEIRVFYEKYGGSASQTQTLGTPSCMGSSTNQDHLRSIKRL